MGRKVHESLVVSFAFENKSNLFEVEPDFTAKGFYVLIYLVHTLDVSANLDALLHVSSFLVAESMRCFKTWTLGLKGGSERFLMQKELFPQ